MNIYLYWALICLIGIVIGQFLITIMSDESFGDVVPFTITSGIVVYLEIVLFIALGQFSQGLSDWIGVPVNVAWWISFLFLFVELMMVVGFFWFVILGVIYD
jgi:hypothetical protein